MDGEWPGVRNLESELQRILSISIIVLSHETISTVVYVVYKVT